MIRYALARPITPRRRPAAAAAAPARLARHALATLAMLALALALAAAARADHAVMEARSPRTLPALDARVDGIPASRAATPAKKPVAAKAVDPAAVKAGTTSTAPAVAKAPAPRDSKVEKPAPADARADKPATATAKDARKLAVADDEPRDVLADLGRELRELGRWLTENNWE